MRYRRYGLLLHNGSRTQQRSGRHKKDITVFPRSHGVQDMPAQYRSAASASRAARMNVLFFIKDQDSAVIMPLPEVNSLFKEKIPQQPRAYSPEIPCEYHIIVARPCSRPFKIAVYGVRRSRC